MNENISKKIIENVDIVSAISSFIPLQKKGNNYVGICPFHGDNNPSLTVSPSKKIFKCFSCQESGTVIDFVMKFNSLNYINAINLLNEQFNLELNLNQFKNNEPEYTDYQRKMIKANEDANSYFKLSLFQLINQEDKLNSFIKSRKLTEDLINEFEIGYAYDSPNFLKIMKMKNNSEDILINSSLITENNSVFFKNRVTFAIKNENGDTVGFSARVLESDAKSTKYLNSSQNNLFSKSKILYNFHNAKNHIPLNNEIIICEGFMDVIALYKANFKNSIALMGTALTQDHVDLLKKYNVILMLDGDRAGIEATKKSLSILIKNNVKVEIVNNDTNFDPDEYLNKFGKQELINLIKKRISPLSYMYNILSTNVDINNFITVDNFINDLLIFLENSDWREKEIYLKKIETDLKIPALIIEKSINKYKNNKIIRAENSFQNDNNNFNKIILNNNIHNKFNIEFNRKRAEIITSIALIPQMRELYLKQKDDIDFNVNDKKIINDILATNNKDEILKKLNKNNLYSTITFNDENDWDSAILDYNDKIYKNRKIEITKLIKEKEKELENEQDPEKRKILNSRIDQLLKISINMSEKNKVKK
ncbi:DNA primase [Mesomycoplasma lagogenitalium]|uniref:DNA primase n=1 Tax=Mesomycoplasma lagogenitalium TaxID=171286 RepID=A0ABY8LXQ1_9BACT|nr:DNA primase [Mesomycoplasma lagogenitalium]WGI37046.1 DNA primase [Mesomycoplasma lagogenitalium]